MEPAHLPEGWVVSALAPVVAILDSRRVPVNARERSKRPGPIPYYGAAGQVGWIDGFLFDEELVLLAEDGAPFLDGNKPKAYLVRGKSWVNNHAHVLRALGGIPNRFLMHWLNQVDYRPFVSGTTRLKLPQAPMRQISVPIPPLPEQHRIAEAIESHFTRLDAVVATLERVKANLKRYRASVLKAAVEGTLTAEWRQRNPHTEPASELLKRILAQRRRRWEDKQIGKFKEAGTEPPRRWNAKYREPAPPDTTNLPPLPEGWCWASLDQLTADSSIGLDRGLQYQKRTPPGSPYIKMNNVTMDGRLLLNDLVFVETTKEEQERYAVLENDLLFNTRNSNELVGKVGIAKQVPFIAVYNNNLMRLRFDGAIQPSFACLQMCSSSFRTRMEAVKKATTSIAAVYAKDLFLLPLALPPLTEQEVIAEVVEDQLSVTDHLEANLQRNFKSAQALRRAILHHAFSGQLVPRDPNDEPASELLRRIVAESGKAPEASHQAPRRPKAKRKKTT